MRPPIGARTSLHSRLSSACFSAASRRADLAGGIALGRLPGVEFALGQGLVARPAAWRARRRRWRSRAWPARAPRRPWPARPRADRGAGSMTNSRSPCLTIWPSLKWMESMKPDTRARTSTVSTAAKRPVYSSHSVIVFCSGCETVTGGGGGAAPATGLLSQPASMPANNAATMKTAALSMALYFMQAGAARKPVHCFLFSLVFQRDVSPAGAPRCRSAANAAPPA